MNQSDERLHAAEARDSAAEKLDQEADEHAHDAEQLDETRATRDQGDRKRHPQDREHGARMREMSSDDRAMASQDRLAGFMDRVTGTGDAGMVARGIAAYQRDVAANQRDEEADSADLLADQLDEAYADSAELERERHPQDRELAADRRGFSASDRKRAAADRDLAAVLSEFAHTMVTDFPIQAILDHLVQRIVDVLPVKAAGVILISPGMAPHYVAASDQYALVFEKLQSRIGQGPCLSAYESGEAIAIPDLLADASFPLFTPAAVMAGMAAVFTFPLRHAAGRFGALDLFRDTPGDLDPADLDAAQMLADVVAAYLLNAQAREDALVSSGKSLHSALHDPLTGLPNRVLLKQRLEHAAKRAQRSHTNAAVLFADLDRFKEVNDVHGHQVGDAVLLAVAQRLASLVRPGDTLARVSGDEFVILCEDLTCTADVDVLASRIDEAFADSFVIGSTELTISASVGIAFAGCAEDISERLVEQADTAMYQAKRKGGAGHQVIDLREALRTSDRSSLERDLRTAFANRKLQVAYQPIVRVADGLVTGVEALLRWTDPDRGHVPALSMVAVAEESGLIGEIGAWILECSCRDRCRWLHDYPGAPLDVAVNVSARQLMSPDFRHIVEDVLAKTGMDPSALVLEMTENIVIDDSERAMTVLADLRQLGIRLAMDDFGTGYSSLSYLRRLPLEIVKIDQSFIADMGINPTSGAIVAAVTNLAHVLGLSVNAEGVETQSQRDEVDRMGCDSAQGYFYARPMPTSAIEELLAAQPITSPLHLPVS